MRKEPRFKSNTGLSLTDLFERIPPRFVGEGESHVGCGNLSLERFSAKLNQADAALAPREPRKLPQSSPGMVLAFCPIGAKSGVLLAHDQEFGGWGNRLLAAFPTNVFQSLERDLRRLTLGRGALCFDAGTRIDRVYFPITGMVSLVVPLDSGESIETGTVGLEGGAGVHCGLGERISYARAMVQIPGDFAVISAARLQQAVRTSAILGSLIVRYTETLWAEAQQTAACNALHPASARICRWLLQTADRIGRDDVPLTQEYLAEMLGVRRTTVTLLAQELQKHGAIKYSRGKIALLDREALASCACECYDAVTREKGSLKVDRAFAPPIRDSSDTETI